MICPDGLSGDLVTMRRNIHKHQMKSDNGLTDDNVHHCDQNELSCFFGSACLVGLVIIIIVSLDNSDNHHSFQISRDKYIYTYMFNCS